MQRNKFSAKVIFLAIFAISGSTLSFSSGTGRLDADNTVKASPSAMAQATPVSVVRGSPTISIQMTPEQTLISKAMVGDYSQHSTEFKRLFEFAQKNITGATHGIGIYPQDPDAVGMQTVEWTIGLVLSPDPTRPAIGNITPYRVQVLPVTLSAVVETTMGKAESDGLYLLGWLPKSGYVQTGPTRMEYMGNTPGADNPVRILVPLKKRARAIG